MSTRTVVGSPSSLGLPEKKFPDWRGGQEQAVGDILAGHRVLATMQPTGFGKSLVYVAAGVLLSGQTVILTATKALQDQLMRDFECVGMRSIKGMNAYWCREQKVPCNTGPCRAGYGCRYKDDGCPYYDALREAKSSNLVVTNYAFWMSHNRFGEKWDPDLLVLDEAHQAPELLNDFRTIELQVEDLDMLSVGHPAHPSLPQWIKWADDIIPVLELDIKETSETVRTTALLGKGVLDLIRLKAVLSAVERLANADNTWVMHQSPEIVRFGPVGGSPENTRANLFGDASRVVLTSGTLSSATMEMLHLEDYQYTECTNGFDVNNRPVYYLPGPPITRRVSLTGVAGTQWVGLMDSIIQSREDRKGIIHTSSFKQRDVIYEKSRYANIMYTNKRSDLSGVVSDFKRNKKGAVMVSPSLSSGHDFPGDLCRYQIIAKVPFPFLGDEILAARVKRNPKLLQYITMQRLVQSAGRGVRSADDFCETFIVDGVFEKWWAKWSYMAPGYFREAVKRRNTAPYAPKLRKGE